MASVSGQNMLFANREIAKKCMRQDNPRRQDRYRYILEHQIVMVLIGGRTHVDTVLETGLDESLKSFVLEINM